MYNLFLAFARAVWQAQPPAQEPMAARPVIATEAFVYLDSMGQSASWCASCPDLATCLPELPKPEEWDPSFLGGREMTSQVHKTPRFFSSKQGRKTGRARPVQSRADFGTWLRQNDPYAPPGAVQTGVPTHGRATLNRKVRPEKAFVKAQRAMALKLCDAVTGRGAGPQRSASSASSKAVYVRCGYCPRNIVCGPDMEAAVQEHMDTVHKLPSGKLSVYGKATVNKVKTGTADLANSVLQGTAKKRLRQGVRQAASQSQATGRKKLKKATTQSQAEPVRKKSKTATAPSRARDNSTSTTNARKATKTKTTC